MALFCALGLIAAWQSSVSANTMTVQITGTINGHTPNQTGGGFWDASVFDGQTYTFSLQFDSLAPDSDSDPTVGMYDSSGASFQCSIKFGNYTFTTSGTIVKVYNDFFNGTTTQDGFFFFNENAFTQNGLSLTPNAIQTNFFFANTSFLSSDSLSGV